MPLIHRFRVGLYALVCLATFCLWLGEDDPALPYPWLFMLWAVATYAFTDVWERMVTPARLSTWLGILAVSLFAWEGLHTFAVNPVLPLGHLLVYLQVLILAQAKSARTYWFILIMSFLQMMIAALHNLRLLFGLLLFAYLALLVWTLTQFLLWRESQRYGSGTTAGGSGTPSVSLRPVSERNGAPRLQWLHNLAWLRQTLGTFRASGLIVAVTLALFLVIPRAGQTAWHQPLGKSGPRLVGFDDQVRLGQLGTILDSSDEVMTVQMFDENGVPYRPAKEPLWRGVALQYYRNGRWQRQQVYQDFSDSPWVEGLPDHYIRQDIRLQAIHPEVLFGMRPAYAGQTRDGDPLALATLDGTLLRPNLSASGSFHYTLESGMDRDGVQPRESLVSDVVHNFEPLRKLTQVPPELRGPLAEYVARVLSPDVTDPEEICLRLQAHLQDPRLFQYTLEENVSDSNIDPVLDFLLNRRAGHCEYFASALVLMLRVRGVPARLVNGFKGGDWNELVGRFMVVRQRHAHSWVEAIVTPNDKDYHWITLDPTPGQARQAVVAQIGGVPVSLRQLYDASKHVWSSYVLNFNAGEQEAAVYGPIREFIQDSPQLWGPVLLAVSLLFVGLAFGRRPVRWLMAQLRGQESPVNKQPRGGPRGRLLAWVANWLRTLFTPAAWFTPSGRPRIAFYERLLRVLESHGLSKLPTWTPQQFAQQAGLVLERQRNSVAVARIPAELIDYFYRARFGQHRLGAHESAEIDLKLRSLTEALSRKE